MPRMSVAHNIETVADLLRYLGRVHPSRVLVNPPLGEATERDLIRLNEHTNRLYELVDGVLVAKVLSWPESCLAMRIACFVSGFLEQRDLGVLAGGAGPIRLKARLVRLPDLSFVSWDRLPVRGLVPTDPILKIVPDMVAEVLKKGNTKQEMARKLRDYFSAGVRLVWFVDSRRRTVTVYTAPDRFVVLSEDQTLIGGNVLPGFTLPLRKLFAQVAGAKASAGKRKSRRG